MESERIWIYNLRPMQNITKVIISSSRRRPGSSDFKDFLDSASGLPRTRYGVRNDRKRNYSKVSNI